METLLLCPTCNKETRIMRNVTEYDYPVYCYDIKAIDFMGYCEHCNGIIYTDTYEEVNIYLREKIHPIIGLTLCGPLGRLEEIILCLTEE
jgi:hypothetical protein